MTPWQYSWKFNDPKKVHMLNTQKSFIECESLLLNNNSFEIHIFFSLLQVNFSVIFMVDVVFQSRSQRHLPVSVVNSSRQAEAVAASASRKHLRREASRPQDHVKGKPLQYMYFQHILLKRLSWWICFFKLW